MNLISTGALAGLALGAWLAAGDPAPIGATVWHLDDLDRVAGHRVSVVGSPRVVATSVGPVVEFDGLHDGLFLDVNPIAGLDRFTIEVMFEAAADGAEEQRFLHIQESASEDRALVELRRLPDTSWTLDTFLKRGDASLTLIERRRTHPASRWHVAALTYDGTTMAHFVDGVREASGAVRFMPLGPGRTSIGVRQNGVSWFKGRISQLRFSAEALPPDRLMRPPASREDPVTSWARGFESQRKADLGDGRYLNPIMAGDHPDPSILKDGADYYMTFSSFDAYPGLVIWRSRDLVNWQPVAATLTKHVGSVWAPDLVKHRGRYYIYFPARTRETRSNYVIWADHIRGPWSEPIDLRIGHIDPGHIVSDDGQRHLFLSDGHMIALADDGLSVRGEMKKVYDGWRYPEEWIVESFSQEGPKMLKHGDYYYMVLAEGGTAGPPTGHMIVAARARALDGPWESSPYNPIVRTQASSERWWSKGHGTLVEGPGGRWYLVYHAYENGFYTLGRQTLLEPIEWTSDQWFKTAGYDVARPIPKPDAPIRPHAFPLSDDFSTSKMGVQWSFYNGTEGDVRRYRYENNSLVLRAQGSTPADSSPLWFVAGDQAYEVEVEIDADAGTTAGLLVFYSRKLYAGLGYSATNVILHRYGTERALIKSASLGQRAWLRLRNDRHIVTLHYSSDGRMWERFGIAMEVSGYHHNVAGEFSSLRPALYAAGSGEARFRNFKYRALP